MVVAVVVLGVVMMVMLVVAVEVEVVVVVVIVRRVVEVVAVVVLAMLVVAVLAEMAGRCSRAQKQVVLGSQTEKKSSREAVARCRRYLHGSSAQIVCPSFSKRAATVVIRCARPFRCGRICSTILYHPHDTPPPKILGAKHTRRLPTSAAMQATSNPGIAAGSAAPSPKTPAAVPSTLTEAQQQSAAVSRVRYLRGLRNLMTWSQAPPFAAQNARVLGWGDEDRKGAEKTGDGNGREREGEGAEDREVREDRKDREEREDLKDRKDRDGEDGVTSKVRLQLKHSDWPRGCEAVVAVAAEGDEWLVRGLQTALGKVAEAVVRSEDLESVSVQVGAVGEVEDEGDVLMGKGQSEGGARAAADG